MTTEANTPEKGQDSIGTDRDERLTLDRVREMSDEELSLVIEDRKQEMRESADEVAKALLNEDVPLTSERVQEFWDASTDLEALARGLVFRVPEKQQQYRGGDE